MAGAKKARKRSLAQQLGTVGTDPFIPARQPRSLVTAPPVMAGRVQRPRRGRASWALARVVVGVALAGAGVWGAFFAQPTLAARVQALGVLPGGAGPVAALALAAVAFILGVLVGLWGSVALRRARLVAEIDSL